MDETTATTNAPADPATALLALLKAATKVVHVHRSSFPPSDPVSVALDAGVAWLRANRPAVDVQIVTDPRMADTVVFFRVDDAVWAGPLYPPVAAPFLPLAPGAMPNVAGITTDQFEQFFTADAANPAPGAELLPYNALVPLADGTTQIDDFSRLNATGVVEVVGPQQKRWPWTIAAPTEADFCNLVAEAVATGRSISLSGRRHSQGGHTFAASSMVIDMLGYDKVVSLDTGTKRIRVQAGITWDAVQRYIQPHRLSVAVMQAYPYFTVGGAISVDVHESDIRFGPIIETVTALRVLLADGSVVDLGPDDELFGLVIGGYGLFGLVLEVELQLTDDIPITETIVRPTTETFAQKFAETQKAKDVIFAGARPCFVLDDPGLLRDMEMNVCTQVADPGDPGFWEITDPGYLGLRKLIYDLSRSYEWGAQLKWDLQKQLGDEFGMTSISRTNYVRDDIRIPGDHRSATDADAMQEYFVPTTRFHDFTEGLRAIMLEHRLNVMSIGVRWVPQTTRSMLTYSPNADMFGAIMVINHGTSPDEIEAVKGWTREIVDLVLSVGGTYYLPYAAYPTREQCRRSFPRFDEFVAAKTHWDPNHVFMNQFFENYA